MNAYSLVDSPEEERLRPQKAPDISISPIPGTAIRIVEEYPSQPSLAKLKYSILYIPEKYFCNHNTDTKVVWGVNLQLHYPSMQPLEFSKRLREWPSDALLLSITMSDRSLANNAAEDLHRRMSNQSTTSNKSIFYFKRNVPEGYSEAYTIHPRSPLHKEEWDFVRSDSSGKAVEFAVCSPHAVNPTCSFLLKYDRTGIDIQYQLSMERFQERVEVNKNILSFIDSLLVRPNTINKPQEIR